MNDFLKQRAEKDLAELKKLIENHFAQRKEDEAVLAELVEKMEKRKEVRQKQNEDRAQREKERAQREREERQKKDEIEAKRKLEEEEKKKEALAAMSMNYGGYLAKRQEQARNKRGGAEKEKKKKILADRRKPLNIDHMDNDKLQAKAKELHDWLVELVSSKVDIEVNLSQINYHLKCNRSRYNDARDAKAKSGPRKR
ncbi:Oidioi.mRNA.OKI2018_I69.chr1.g2470.t1.cds [Oikopleura dioica]|uniref:Oidioi.mRNA.OKI2018_I69.chr1.g2470.t1.cds n=1 Tax=Oikopleura dioica TaxID=34765 RepID=A0ABN7SY39_OIKDI|nr:Oidioi.mRNA.OKI2018_I69.chr1.g2470.t1.cds [Oikopleura dioica]